MGSGGGSGGSGGMEVQVGMAASRPQSRPQPSLVEAWDMVQLGARLLKGGRHCLGVPYRLWRQNAALPHFCPLP